MCVLSRFNCVQFFATPWTVDLLFPWDSPGKNTGVGCHALLQGDLPDRGIEPASPVTPALQAVSLLAETPGKPNRNLG